MEQKKKQDFNGDMNLRAFRGKKGKRHLSVRNAKRLQQLGPFKDLPGMLRGKGGVKYVTRALKSMSIMETVKKDKSKVT